MNRNSKADLHRSRRHITCTGVAAANLGTNPKTIDSVFHTNRADAVEDLTGDALDNLVSDLESVEVASCPA